MTDRLAPGPDGCTLKTRRCPLARRSRSITPPCCRRHLVELLADLVDVFAVHGVTWWADYGTLLGAVREGGMIEWDKDADLGFLAADWDLVEAAGAEMERDRRRPYRRLKLETLRGSPFRTGDYGRVQASQLNRMVIELFPWYLKLDSAHSDAGATWYRKNYFAVDRYKGRDLPDRRLFPLSTVTFNGLEIPAPRDPEWVLEYRYGPRWRTPSKESHEGIKR